MHINLITSVPEFFEQILSVSMLGRAVAAGAVTFRVVSLRDFAPGNLKKQVDDRPFGGGPGMILKIEPIVRALDYLSAQNQRGTVYLTSPQGTVFHQAQARAWSHLDCLTLICGHYEGVDARITHFIDGQISLGNFVLTGGEPAALAMIDATVRLLPGVLGNADSLTCESFDADCLEYPQYTRPSVFRGLSVPDV